MLMLIRNTNYYNLLGGIITDLGIIDSQGVYEIYDIFEDTINKNIFNSQLLFNNVSIGYRLILINDGRGKIKIKFNSIDQQDQTINNKETFIFNGFKFKNVYLSNTSNRNANYRIRIEGV